MSTEIKMTEAEKQEKLNELNSDYKYYENKAGNIGAGATALGIVTGLYYFLWRAFSPEQFDMILPKMETNDEQFSAVLLGVLCGVTFWQCLRYACMRDAMYETGSKWHKLKKTKTENIQQAAAVNHTK